MIERRNIQSRVDNENSEQRKNQMPKGIVRSIVECSGIGRGSGCCPGSVSIQEFAVVK